MSGRRVGSTPKVPSRTLAVPGEGTWTADPISGAVTFAPEPSFTGTTTPVGYALRDGFGNTATALETVTVAPVTPSAATRLPPAASWIVFAAVSKRRLLVAELTL